MIVAQGWNSASVGGTVNYSVSIHNPDPGAWSSLLAYVFVGPANSIVPVGEALAAVDPRFPRLTMPEFWGLTLAPNESQSSRYALTVPGGRAAFEARELQSRSGLRGTGAPPRGRPSDSSVLLVPGMLWALGHEQRRGAQRSRNSLARLLEADGKADDEARERLLLSEPLGGAVGEDQCSYQGSARQDMPGHGTSRRGMARLDGPVGSGPRGQPNQLVALTAGELQALIRDAVAEAVAAAVDDAPRPAALLDRAGTAPTFLRHRCSALTRSFTMR
jgi:hypothetical protein